VSSNTFGLRDSIGESFLGKNGKQKKINTAWSYHWHEFTVQAALRRSTKKLSTPGQGERTLLWLSKVFKKTVTVN